MKPLRGFLSGISTPMWGTFSALWERVCKGPQVLRTRGYPKVGHLRRPLHSLHVLYGTDITRFISTSLVSARTTTKRNLIDFSPLQMGAALKVPNSCVTAGAAGTCGLQAHHPEVGAESAQPQRTKKYVYE